MESKQCKIVECPMWFHAPHESGLPLTLNEVSAWANGVLETAPWEAIDVMSAYGVEVFDHLNTCTQLLIDPRFPVDSESWGSWCRRVVTTARIGWAKQYVLDGGAQ